MRGDDDRKRKGDPARARGHRFRYGDHELVHTDRRSGTQYRTT